MSDSSNDGADQWPAVSVILPIRDEAADLERAVQSILAQEYPRPLEVCLAVAPSSDGTEEVAQRLAARDDRVRVVPNPAGATPAGLNAAIRATSGAVVVRVDGHAELSDGYVRRAVETMRRTGAVNVGGVQAATGRTPFERAVAAAMTSWLGTGGARFHVGGHEGPVDTVYLGVFDRAALEDAGGFDESLIRNQDYELNIRLRRAGGAVWFDPELVVSYRPRGSLRALARQYYEYGWWKAVVAKRFPGSLRARQVAPVVLTVSLGAATLLGVRRPRWLSVPVVYVAAVGAAAASLRHRPATTFRLLVVVPTMHVSWGVGFVVAAARAALRRDRPTNGAGTIDRRDSTFPAADR